MQALRRRVGTHLREKAAVRLELSVGICVPYFTLQRLMLFEPRPVPATLLDAWVAFEPD